MISNSEGAHMKAITIRGIDPEIDDKLKMTASKHGKSINQLILDILKKDLGLEKKQVFSKEYDDLDDLFGQWSEEEFRMIQDGLDQQRRIDPEIWK